MDIETVRDYLKNKQLACEIQKSETTFYYKVNGKVFAILSTQVCPHIILKNEPLLNEALRKQFNFIFPSYYFMNKQYWNVVALVDDLTDQALFRMIDKSYTLTIEKMTKKQKMIYRHCTVENA